MNRFAYIRKILCSYSPDPTIRRSSSVEADGFALVPAGTELVSEGVELLKGEEDEEEAGQGWVGWEEGDAEAEAEGEGEGEE